MYEYEFEYESSAERSESPAHASAALSILRTLTRQGGRLATADSGGGIRYNRAQIGNNGHVFDNKPDVSYIGRVGNQNMRVNVEVDTTPQGSRAHERQLIRQDPNSMHIFVQVDERGQPIAQRIYDPRVHNVPGRRRAQVVPHQAVALPALAPNQRRASGTTLRPTPVQVGLPRLTPTQPTRVRTARRRNMIRAKREF